METKIINGGTHRYLSELDEFKDGMPFGVINKSKTDVGGTFVAANCNSNYIIVCPFIDLVESIATDKNNKYPIFKCYGGIREYQFTKYLKEHSVYKVAVTYDSLPKLIRWMGTTEGWKVLIDEYHLILEDMDFRTDSITNLMNEVQKFKHYSFLSATPMNMEFEIDFLKKLPHYKVEWDNLIKIQPISIKTTKLTKALTRFIQIFIEEGISLPNVEGDKEEVKELYVFINSVTTIKQILDTLKLEPDEVKICCADRNRNRLLLDNYQVESVSRPNKRINFFTKKCFQGCNLFTNNGLVIIASDGYRTNTLVDISTTMEQIAGRIRINNEYQNTFRDKIIHLFSTNNQLLTDEEFASIMEEKEANAADLIGLYNKGTDSEKKTLKERLESSIESDLVSFIGDTLVYNELKKQSFIYKQQLRKCYKDGITLRKEFIKSDRYYAASEETWTDFNVKMAKAVTISYEQLLKDYLEHPTTSYEMEYPEFPEYRKYLKESEMNTLRWNKEKLLKAVEDKKKMNLVFDTIYSDGFVSSKDLKDRFRKAFDKYGISLTPKASLIEGCTIYSITKTAKRIDGKKVAGYELSRLNYNL